MVLDGPKRVTGGEPTLEDSDGGGEVVDATGSAEGSGDDGGRGDEIVGKAVVEVSLEFCQLVRRVLRFELFRARSSASGDRSGDAGGPYKPCDKHTWSSKTSFTLSNSFSYLRCRKTSQQCRSGQAQWRPMAPSPATGASFLLGHDGGRGGIIPGSKLLERLLGVLVAASDGRLREWPRRAPCNGAGSVGRSSHAHSTDPRCGAHEGHCGCQWPGGKLQEQVQRRAGGLIGRRRRGLWWCRAGFFRRGWAWSFRSPCQWHD